MKNANDYLQAAFIGYAVVLIWASMLYFAKNKVYVFHTSFIPLSKENFNFSHYLLLGFFKIFVLVEFLIPWLTTLY